MHLLYFVALGPDSYRDLWFWTYTFRAQCIVDTVAGFGQFHYFRGVYKGYGHSPYLIVVLHMDRLKLTFLLTIICWNSFACSCDWGGNFLNSGAFGELVFKGRVIERTYHLSNGEQYNDWDAAYKSKQANNLDEFYGLGESITIEILEIIRGSEQRRKIRIFDSDGADCRDNTGNFNIGSTYIFSAYKPNRSEPKLPNETIDDYAIHACSENWLTFNSETNEVTGRIKGNNIRRRQTTWTYERLLEEITEHNRR